MAKKKDLIRKKRKEKSTAVQISSTAFTLLIERVKQVISVPKDGFLGREVNQKTKVKALVYGDQRRQFHADFNGFAYRSVRIVSMGKNYAKIRLA